MGKKVCVIGAGLGGLSIALLLSMRGHEVLVFERSGMVGGRALSLKGSSLSQEQYEEILRDYKMKVAFSIPTLQTIFEKHLLDGFTLDLGFHSVEGGTTSDVGWIVEKASSDPTMLGTRLGFVEQNGFSFPLVRFKDKLRFLPLILRLLLAGEKKMKELDDISIEETIRRYAKKKMKLILELLPRVTTTVNDLNRISTGESLRAAQSNLNRGSSPVGYPIGGFEEVNAALLDACEKKGVKVVLNAPVEKIVIAEGKATGVVQDGEKYPCDLVIYNGLVQDLFRIADSTCFSDEYVESLRSLTGTGSLCAYYALKTIPPEVEEKSFLFIDRSMDVEGGDAVGMIEFVTANPGAQIAPKDQFLVQAYIICSPKEAVDSKVLERLRFSLDDHLRRLFPEYQKHLVWALYPTIWHLDGVAKTIDNQKPSVRTPVEGLFLVGDCTKAPGIGVNGAVKSARILDEVLVELGI